LYCIAAARKDYQVPVDSVVAGVDTVLTMPTVGVVTAVDVAVVSVDCEAVEAGVVVCVVTLDTDTDVGGVVVAVVAVDTVAVVTVDSDSVVSVVGAVVLTIITHISILSKHCYTARQLILYRNCR